MGHPIAQPLRPLTEAERQELIRATRAPSEARRRHQRATALLAVANDSSLTEAARAAGWRVCDTVASLIRRFNAEGLAALDDRPRSGRPRRYGPAERERILMEVGRQPDRGKDGSATWSLSLLQRALHEAPDGTGPMHGGIAWEALAPLPASPSEGAINRSHCIIVHPMPTKLANDPLVVGLWRWLRRRPGV